MAPVGSEKLECRISCIGVTYDDEDVNKIDRKTEYIYQEFNENMISKTENEEHGTCVVEWRKKQRQMMLMR